MQKALFLTVAAGLVIGLMWPSGGPPSAPASAANAAATADAPSAPRETVLQRSNGGHFYANVEVNGELVRFLVDTGATGIALTEKDAQRIGIAFSRDDFSEVGMGAGGPVRGERVKIDRIVLDGKEARGLGGVVLEGADTNLLGQAYLGQFSVEMRGDRMRIY